MQLCLLAPEPNLQPQVLWLKEFKYTILVATVGLPWSQLPLYLSQLISFPSLNIT
jgi:hypothetical protein